MKGYRIRVGKAGIYGEHKVVTWTDERATILARIYDNNDGTVEVTLYSADELPHPRNRPKTDRVEWDVCEAHVRERGFDTLISESSDVRAYND